MRGRGFPHKEFLLLESKAFFTFAKAKYQPVAEKHYFALLNSAITLKSLDYEFFRKIRMRGRGFEPPNLLKDRISYVQVSVLFWD